VKCKKTLVFEEGSNLFKSYTTNHSICISSNAVNGKVKLTLMRPILYFSKFKIKNPEFEALTTSRTPTSGKVEQHRYDQPWETHVHLHGQLQDGQA
jgi:hypothetical protein